MTDKRTAAEVPEESAAERYTRDALVLASRALRSFALVFLPAPAIRRRLDDPAARRRFLEPHLFAAAAVWATAAAWRAGWSEDPSQFVEIGLDAVLLTALPVIAAIVALSRLCVALAALGVEGREPCTRILGYAVGLHFTAAAVGLAAGELFLEFTPIKVSTLLIWGWSLTSITEYGLRLWAAANVTWLVYGYWAPLRALAAGMPLRAPRARRLVFAGMAGAMGFGPTAVYLALFYLGPAHANLRLSLDVDPVLLTWTRSATVKFKFENFLGSELEVNDINLEAVPCDCMYKAPLKEPKWFKVGMESCTPIQTELDMPFTLTVPANTQLVRQDTWTPSADERRYLGRGGGVLCCRASTSIPKRASEWVHCGQLSEIDASAVELLAPLRPKVENKGVEQWSAACQNEGDRAACAEACAQGHTSSCEALASHQGLDARLKSSLLAMSCDAFSDSSGRACRSAALDPLSGEGWGLLRLDQACERGDAAGCALLGEHLLAARGHSAAVRELLERGCSSDAVDGCLRLGDYLAADESSALAPSAALRAWWRACVTDPLFYSEACARIDAFSPHEVRPLP